MATVIAGKAETKGSSPVVPKQAGSVEHPAATAEANGSSPAVPEKAGSGEQPGTFLPLEELTDRSARIAHLKLSVSDPWEDNYTYTWSGE